MSHPRFIVVNQEFIEAGATLGCGFTNAQIRLLDGPGRPRKGWISRAVGKTLSYERAREFLIDARRAKYRPKPGSIEEGRVLALLRGVAPQVQPEIWRITPVKHDPEALLADTPPWK